MKFRLEHFVLIFLIQKSVHGGLRAYLNSFSLSSITKLPYLSDENENDNNIVQPVPPQAHQYAAYMDDGITAIRIEYIKNQILKKLRLKEKPQIAKAQLPTPVKEYNLFSDHDGSQQPYDDDFYGKTTQAIIFPYEDKARCLRKLRYPSACLPFQMPNDIRTADVSMAQLWVYKKKDVMDAHNQTFIIYEIAHWDSSRNFQKTKPLAIEAISVSEGWLSIDVTLTVKNWLQYEYSSIHALNVVCKYCDMNVTESPVSFSSELKPFLVIHTHSQHRRPLMHHHRQRRSNDCPNSSNECCRESLYISFADIGWDDWIIKPEGYNAYFCRGSCSSASAMTISATYHNSILQKVMGQKQRYGSRPELTPCCAATQFQPLQLVYMHSNKTLTSKRLTNMIVDSCGCM